MFGRNRGLTGIRGIALHFRGGSRGVFRRADGPDQNKRGQIGRLTGGIVPDQVAQLRVGLLNDIRMT